MSRFFSYRAQPARPANSSTKVFGIAALDIAILALTVLTLTVLLPAPAALADEGHERAGLYERAGIHERAGAFDKVWAWIASFDFLNPGDRQLPAEKANPDIDPDGRPSPTPPPQTATPTDGDEPQPLGPVRPSS